MTPASTTFYRRHREALLSAMHILALASLAVAQPLFSGLANNPTFLVANRLGAREILTLVGIVWLGIPVVIVAAERCIALFNKKAAGIFYIASVGVLIFVMILPVAKKLTFLNGISQSAIAIILAAVGTYAYSRISAVRLFVSGLSPAILVVPGMFLFFSPVVTILFPPDRKSMEGRNLKADTPIVLVVFDEFSLVSLMDSGRTIDSVRYPNFHKLAGTATWFRNATTVCDASERIVPAILTGRFPDIDSKLAPNRGNYPENLLTLLHEAYDVRVMESVTDLSMNPEVESLIPTSEMRKGLPSLLSDMKSMFLRIILPNDILIIAPTLEKSWGGFALQQSDSSKRQSSREESWQPANQFRREKFRIFIDSVRTREKPPLYFIHTLLPHVPYEYLPSGKRYLGNPYNSPEYGLQGEYWNNMDEGKILESWQRYLLQVGFIDRLVGELVAQLEREKLFEKSLLIVTADHGVSFKSWDYRRPLTPNNYMDILPVPLFLKAPGQKEGAISDANVDITDILPTIASILKIEIPWRTDGSSVFDPGVFQRKTKRAVSVQRRGNSHQVGEYGAEIPGKDSTLAYQLSNLGSGTPHGDLYKIGKYRDVIGKPLSMVSVKWSRDFLTEIEHRGYYESLSLSDDPLLTEISGNIQFFEKATKNTVAIIVNDTIWAVREIEDTVTGSYSGIIPEHSLLEGLNTIEVGVLAQLDSLKPILYRSLLTTTDSIRSIR